jgi:hypothetical protein
MMAIDYNWHETLEKSREGLKRYAESDCREEPKYLKGDLVILSGNNICTPHPCRKLDQRLHGPFEITEVIMVTAVYLNLLMKLTIRKVFDGSLVEPFGEGT